MIGTYEILCVVNQKRYIGGSKSSVENRLSSHKAQLNAQKHYNKLLQEDWSKYGPSQFLFKITKICEVAEVRTQEQKRLSYWKSRCKVYNLHPDANSAKGFRYTAEQKKVASVKAKARCTTAWRAAVSARVKLQHAKGKLGRATWKPGTAEQQRQKMLAQGAKNSARLKELWKGEMGRRLRQIHQSAVTREKHRQAILQRFQAGWRKQ